MTDIPPRSIKQMASFWPTHGPDADRAFEIQTDWEVTRMLSMA